MVRTPEADGARERIVNMRLSPAESKALDEKKAARGIQSTSKYLRALIEEDEKKR